MGEKVIIRFWWESELSSASRDHLTTFGRPFVQYAQGRTQGDWDYSPTLSLIFYENFITCAKEINSFRILFAC